MYIHINIDGKRVLQGAGTDMTTIFARTALTPDGWRENVRITFADGRIAAVNADAAPQPGDERHDVLVPGMPNLHSHAFQRGMAGLAEIRGPGADSFWSWRTVMYRFALSMTPDQVEAVASQLYMEMLEAGFSRVGEFHYLHHDKDGRPYGDIAEMAGRIAASAGRAGIGLTLLPVFYAHSGFGGSAPAEGQRRFINSLDSFEALLDGCRAAVRTLPGSVTGAAPHSLRAVTPGELRTVTAMAGDNPVHIHVSEQVREVEDCIAWSGARPVEWLLDNTGLSERWCLIHATHMTADETARMAKSGAIAGLCPVTEANLGDGTFPAADFIAEGGRFGIGSDQNVLIGISDELRQLEYSQRLARHSRNVIAPPERSTGRSLFDGALAGGGIALQGPVGLAAGLPADLVSLSLKDAPWHRHDTILDAWIFAGSVRPDCVWVHGAKQVEAGRHRLRDEIGLRFRKAMTELTDGL